MSVLVAVIAPGCSFVGCRAGGRTLLLACWLVGGLVSTLAQNKVWDFATGGAVDSTPAIGSDGSLYFGSEDGKVYALTPNGTERWEFQTSKTIAGSPALGTDDTVYIGGKDGRLYALSYRGTLLWTNTTQGQIWSTPAVAVNGTLYVGSLDQHLYAIAPNGKTQWAFAAGGGIYSSPVIAADQTIYFGARDGKVYALNPDGSLRWTFKTGNQVEASPAIAPDGSIVVGSLDSHLYDLRPDGTTNWVFTASAGIYSSAAVGPDGTIYFVSGDGGVYAVKPDGTQLWNLPLGVSVGYSSIALAADGTLYVGAFDGKLYALTAGGTVKWTYLTNGKINLASPTIGADGTVYIGSEDDHLYAVAGGSAPARSGWPMFRLDPRHTGGVFVQRELPAGYSPGEPLTVALVATPLPGVSFYSVEDAVPSGWQVGTNISDNGLYDANSGRVRFGPFFDSQPRTLTYSITPPITESGVHGFDGYSSVNGGDRLVGGEQQLTLIPLHPADDAPVDNWMTIGEAVAYAAAWKQGTGWPTGPNPIPPGYVDRAVNLWLNGEQYHYDTNFNTAPNWWTPSTNATGLTPPPPPTTVSTKGNAVANLPLFGPAGTNFVVTIAVTPATNVTVYAVEDRPPAGWTISDISSGGELDGQQGKVKWGPFFDAQPRTLSYQVTVPADASGSFAFTGAAAFDNSVGTIVGKRAFSVGTASDAGIFVLRTLPPYYSPQRTFTVTLQANPPSGTGAYMVEESPPTGWSVTNVSNGGVYIASTGTVWFGPYSNDQARTLRYTVTPAASAWGLQVFSGQVIRDDNVGTPVAGDDELALNYIPVYPADTQPADGWVTITELTAYGAAWKSGQAWPNPPSPIPDYLLRSTIHLWWGGEQYGFNPMLTNAPDGWFNLTNALSPYVPVAIPRTAVAANGSVQLSLPRLFKPGQPLVGQITVTPVAPDPTNGIVGVANYAVEVTLPSGWSLVSENPPTVFDAFLHKVKWGPYFDDNVRSLSFTVRPSTNASNIATFNGGAAFDGSAAAFTGRRRTYLNSPVSAPQLQSIAYTPDLGAEITARGFLGEVYLFQFSNDLTNWQPLVTLTNDTGTMNYLDTDATNAPTRYYRVVWQ